MNSKINYAGFDQDIREAFSPLMEEYSFVFREIWEGCYELENEHCILKFTFDQGDINCNIRQPKSDDRIGEGVYPVLRFLSPDDEALKRSRTYDFMDTLNEYAAILSTSLHRVLEGDFSWIPELKEYIRQNKIVF
jgi:hypothetical protein